jgi:hypothetical protein
MKEVPNNDVLTVEDVELEGTNWGLMATIIAVIVGLILLAMFLEGTVGGTRFGQTTFSYSPAGALMRA